MIDENLILVLQYLGKHSIVKKFDWFHRWREGVIKYRVERINNHTTNGLNLEQYSNLRVWNVITVVCFP